MSKAKTHIINVECDGEEDGKHKSAQLCLNPAVSSAAIAMQAGNHFNADINYILKAIEDESEKVSRGDISSIEKMLIAQAYSMQSIFTYATTKALTAQYLNQFQAYSKTAMKAQSQCRQTLATLAEIKNPKRTTFIKNQATNQQVNFNENSEKNNQNQSNELLTGNNYETLDARGTTTPIRDNKELATVGA